MAHSARTARKSKHPQIGGSGARPVTPTNSAGETNSASDRRCWESVPSPAISPDIAELPAGSRFLIERGYTCGHC